MPDPLVKNLIALWAAKKPEVGRRTDSRVSWLSGATATPPTFEKWLKVADALRVYPKFMIDSGTTANRHIFSDEEILDDLSFVLPVLASGCCMYWRIPTNYPTITRTQIIYAMSLHVLAHAMSQPVLEDHRGPLVMILTTHPEECIKWASALLDCKCVELGLVLHNLSSDLAPAIPPSRRADLIIGTARSASQWFASRHYQRDRVSLLVLDHPESELRHPINSSDLLSIIAGIPAATQRVLITSVARWMRGQRDEPELWSAVMKACFNTHTDAVAVEPLVTTSLEQQDGQPKRRQPAASDTAECTVVWNIRSDSVLDHLDDFSSETPGAQAPVAIPLLRTSSELSWSAVIAGVKVGAIATWPPCCAVQLFGDAVDMTLHHRNYDGRPLVLVTAAYEKLHGSVTAAETLEHMLPDALLLRNVATADELRYLEFRQELLSDLKAECERLGGVVEATATWVDPSVTDCDTLVTMGHYLDAARVYIALSCPLDAVNCRAGLHGRTFDGRSLHATLVHRSRMTCGKLSPADDGVGVDAVDPLELL